MFFVISGYLITAIILSDMNNGKFSIVTFYERRVRRILPALFFVMLCSFSLAWFWLLPDYFKEFSKSHVAVSLFSSNILFWSESDYFATAAELKLMLHTWSLSVEEQYYLLFPLFLMALWSLRKRWIFGSLMAIAVVSFILAQWGAYSKPSATFFLLPTRGWELAVGALIAFYFLYKREQAEFITSHKFTNEVLGLLGLALITYSVFAFDKSTPFPSFYALIPTIGTVLIIVFSKSETISARLLSTKTLVGIGLISYSTYLWHQPLFVFARHITLEEPSITMLLVLSVLSIVLAYFSWRYIEMPFRDKKAVGRKKVFAFATVGSLVFLVTGLTGAYTGNYASFSGNELKLIEVSEKASETMRKYAYDRYGCFFDYSQTPQVMIENNCIENSTKRRVILFGDSEAAHYLEGFSESSLRYDFDLFQWTGTSCRAFDYPNNSERCKDFLSLFYEEKLNNLTARDVLIVSSNWWNYPSLGLDDEHFRDAIRESLKKLKATGAKIIVFGGTPDFIENPYLRLVKLNRYGDEKNNTYLESHDYHHSDTIINSVVNELDLMFFRPSTSLCLDGDSQECLFREGSDFLFFDAGHLSFYGSSRVVDSFLGEYSYLFSDDYLSAN